MAPNKSNTKPTLGSILKTVQSGFAAVADDIADIKNTMATKADVREIVAEELAPIKAELSEIRHELDDQTEIPKPHRLPQGDRPRARTHRRNRAASRH